MHIFGREVVVHTGKDKNGKVCVWHSEKGHFKIDSKYLQPSKSELKKGDKVEIHGLLGKVVIEKDDKVTINIDGVHVDIELQHVQRKMNRIDVFETNDNPQPHHHLLPTSHVNRKYDAMACVREYVHSVSRAFQHEQEGKADHNGAAAGASATTTPGLAR